MSLLSKLQGSAKEAPVEETVAVTINKVLATNNPLRVVLKTDKGDFFVFVSCFPSGRVPMINKPIKAEITLRERGEFVNVVAVSYDAEQLGKFGLVASFGNAVVL